MKSFAVDPGSNGSVKVDALGATPAGLLRGEREQLAPQWIQEDHVSAIRPGFGQRLVEAPFGDLLELGVEGEHHVVARNRIPDLARRRVVPPPRPILQEDRRARAAGQNGIERQLETGRPDRPVGRQPTDDGSGEIPRRIEALEAAGEVDTADVAQRLDLRGIERAAQIDPALLRPELAVQCRCGGAEVAHQKPEGGPAVLQLVRRDADVVELLRDGERNAVAIVKGTPPRREDHPLGSLALGLPGPAVPLEDLKLSRPPQNGEYGQGEPELDRGDPYRRLGHQGLPVVRRGSTKSVNSESAG